MMVGYGIIYLWTLHLGQREGATPAAEEPGDHAAATSLERELRGVVAAQETVI